MLSMEMLDDGVPASCLMLWQPVTKGETAMNEFLRLKVAAQMMGGDASAEGGTPEQAISTKSLRAALEAGEAQEIAGYELPGPLGAQLFQLSLASKQVPACPVFWLEIVRDAQRPLLPASRRIIEAWSNGNEAVDSRAVAGEPFWRTLEIAECPALIEETIACLSSV